MLDVRIHTFLAVCRTMNFTRAAEQLHITQPAVSQHIRWLETQYGARLFRYEGKQLSLTEAGRLLRQAATTMRHDARHLRQSISQLEGRSVLRFGATLTIGEHLMPRPLARLLEREGEARVHMLMDNTARLLELLDSGEIDFALVEGFFPRTAYESLPLGNYRFLPVCAPDYRCRGPVDGLADLLDERLLVREPGSGSREMLERTLEGHNLTVADFPRRLELGSPGLIKTLVQEGAGVAFFYLPAVRSELKSGLLREIPLSIPPVCHEFSFLWRKGSVFRDQYRAICDALLDDLALCDGP